MDFKEKLSRMVEKNDSLLCVGLDIDKEKMPKHLFKKSKDPYFEFSKSIIDATKGIVCAYKLNMAFYEVLGIEGYSLLEKIIKHIPKEVVIVLDGKRNDIGNTSKKYAQSIFETLKCDAATVNPYLGTDAVKPFLDYKDKYSFILCRTSNPSATDFQDLLIKNKPLYEIVAEKIKDWNKEYNNCGAVVGATYPEELKTIRKILGNEIIFLIPGIGAQGGNIEKTVKYGTNKNGKNALIVSSRSIIYAGTDEDYIQKARNKAISLRNEINSFR